MRDSTEAVMEMPQASAGVHPRPVACIDLDRFCDGCGYNLRTLPVIRDQTTGIPVVRCTECGRYQSATDAATVLRPWLNRATSVLLFAWILTIVSALVLVGMAEGGISYATLDELTLSGGYVSKSTGTTTTITWTGVRGPLQVRTDYSDYELFIAAMMTLSFLTAFSCILLAVVFLPHWPRAAYVGLALSMPVLVGAIVGLAWKYEALHLFYWGLQYIIAHTGIQLLGGLVAVVYGRPFARLWVRILLPPGVRPRLAYLWLVDNKPLPRP